MSATTTARRPDDVRGTSRRRGSGSPRAVFAALALAAVLLPTLAPAPVAAATPTLTIVTAATYTVHPDEGRVAVSVRLTATNRLRDTVTRRFFFRTGFLTVQPGVSNLRIQGGSGSPKVGVSSKTATYTNLRIDLGANLAAGKSTTLTLGFDIKDPGGAPDRSVRVSPSLVSFPVWAFATPETSGSSVAVRFPEGYNVTVGRGPLRGPTNDETGMDEWVSGRLAKPLEFVADVAADRPAEYAETTRSVTMAAGPAEVLLRAWPDDPAWRDRVGKLVEKALPILEREIGVPWPIEGQLVVHEALVRGTGGYAGLFDPEERRIEIAYAASDGVVLHELAHAWFNGRLVADRWAAEAFASYYAEQVAKELGVEATPPQVPADPAEGAIPLNAWGPNGTEDPAAETYSYSASLDVAQTIATMAGKAGLQHVWARAASGVGAYQPEDAGEEAAGGTPDWRGLLDLLEDETGKDFTDVWRTWIARPDDLEALADRAIARGYYTRSADLAGEWRLPAEVRDAMRAWHFDLAKELLLAADGVQAQRADLEQSAAAAGIQLPATLRGAFEGGGLAAAAAEASAEQTIVDAIGAAEAARPTEPGLGDALLIRIGLITAQPEIQLAAARSALATGDLEDAYVAAKLAETAWTNAPDVGRSRIVSAALLVLALVLFAGLVRQALRRRSAEPA